MTDFHRTVGEIRMFLQSADRTDDPRLVGLAKDYAAACAEANERLNRCAFFLRQGLRSEALHLAKAEPDLLDMAAVLDFPERAEWDELAIRYGWAKAPALGVDHAHALNEAYGEEDPLQDLLRRHRRLALARAPLTQRLEVMRQIAQLDTNNPIWIEDIRRFEVARQNEIDQDIQTAKAGLELPRMEAIVRELEMAEWTIAPAEARLDSAHAALGHVRRQVARRALGELAEGLRKAYANSDVTRGRELRARWMAMVDTAALAQGDPLGGEAQGAFDWLRKQDRWDADERAFQEAVLDLQHILETGGNRALLSESEEAVLRFGRGLPKELQSVVKDRYRELGRSERQRTRAILAGVVTAIAIFVALLAWSNAAGNRLTTIERAASKIETLLEAKNLKEAREVLEQLEKTYPGAGQSNACAPAANRLAAAERDEEDRIGRFVQAIKAAQDAPLAEEASASLTTAQMIARLPSEKAEVERVEGTRRALADKRRNEVDGTLRSRLGGLQDKLAVAERMVTQLPKAKETRDSLSALKAQVQSLRADAEKASPTPRAQAMAWIAQLEKVESVLTGAFDRDRLLQQVIQATHELISSGNSIPFVEACQTYIVKFPGEPRAGAFRAVLAERSAWDTLIAWAVMARAWKPPYTELKPKDATDRTQQLTEFRVKYPRWPDTTMSQYHRYLMAIARRDPEVENNASSPLRRVLSNPLFQNAWRIEATTGKTYYSTRKPDVTDDGCLFGGVISIDGRTERVYLTKANVSSIGPAPQSRLAGRIKPLLARAVATPESWDELMGEILAVIQAEPDIDPMPKYILFKAAVHTATLGSEALGEALKEQNRMLRDPTINIDVRWMAPDDEMAGSQREAADRVLRGLPPAPFIAKNAEKARLQLEGDISRVYLPIDILLKDAEGTWHCSAAAKCPPNTGLFVNLPNGSWESIGKVNGDDTGVRIEAAPTTLLEGRMVFTRRGED